MPAELSPKTFAGFAGVNLVADVGGDPGGAPVILIHGGGQTRHSWGSAARELVAKGYYVVALDLRGHGDSDWAPDANYAIEAQVGDLRAVIRQMPTPPVLIGASMGGLISLTAVGEQPDPPVRALVLVDVTPQVDPEGRARIIGFMRDRPGGFASVEEAADAIAAYLPHRPRPKDLSGLNRNLRKQSDGRWYWHWDPRLFDTFETDPAAAVLRYSAAAQNIKVPTLLVRGSKSELVTPQSVAHLQQLIPHAEYADVMDAAHMIAGDRNDAFNEVVLEFLGRRIPANRSQNMLLSQMLRQSASKYPQAPAITIDGTDATYSGLLTASLQRAQMLSALGVVKGDAIGLLLPNSTQLVEILLAASLMGAIVVPINTRFKAMEIAHIVKDASLKFVFTSDQFDHHVNFRDLLREALPGLSGAPDPSHLRLQAFPALRAAILSGKTTDADFLVDSTLLQAAANRAPPTESAAPAAEDPQLILYTSGTTARPKGCIVSGRALAASASGVMKHFDIGARDVWWCPLPMFHIGGILFTSVCLASGAHFVGMSHFEVEGALDQIEKLRPTILYPLFPTIAIPIMRHPRFAGLALDSIRLVVNVATTPVQQDIQSRLPKAALVSAFGMTETTGIVTFNRATDSLEQRTTTVGSALPGWNIKIVDPETRITQAPGQRGEIAVRGPALFSGYLNDPALTAKSFDDDGYFHTGDFGELSAAGLLTFCGRLKDQLKVGGENVSALEVESYLGTHPQVALAQVVGIPDAHYGEVPVAFIELAGSGALDAQGVLDFCRGKIASFKIPKHVRFVTAWPMSATKIHKGKLRDTIIEELAPGS